MVGQFKAEMNSKVSGNEKKSFAFKRKGFD
jgi:hypothetical protein